MKKIKSLERVEECFAKLPSVGQRSAERMALGILDLSKEDVEDFCDALSSLKEKVHSCPVCGCLTEDEICEICKDSTRNHDQILVVSYPKDVFALEKSKGYNGLYHVLGGNISISQGKGIEDLNIDSLVERASSGEVKEIIIATNPTVEGETTALYLARILANYNVSITRIAYGLPMGGNLDYTDSLTLTKAIEGRRKI